ncbi:hypothetical protein [Flavobacterium sp.]|uniref:hypothetical protein n=1 Tax=Flavobacterium sp. TaxID=239 RepID=UPI00261C29C3|nr:hypothetical protein [Flavobacterium sp.]
MKSNKIIELLSSAETLSTHQTIDVENAIDCGEIDCCDIVDCFKLWCSENEDFTEEEIDEYREHFQNLLTFKENAKLLRENLDISK